MTVCTAATDAGRAAMPAAIDVADVDELFAAIPRNAPSSTPLRRLYEARAAKHPVIRQPLDCSKEPA